jgi:D-alanyl-D-alanine carboxypeptidase
VAFVLIIAIALIGVSLGTRAPFGQHEAPSAAPSGLGKWSTAAPTPHGTPEATPKIEATPPVGRPTATATLVPNPTPGPRTAAPMNSATPIPTAAPTPPPTTSDYSRPGGIYLDVLTHYRAYSDAHRSILDTIFMLPADYWPGDLVDTSSAGLNPGYLVRATTIADLRAMADAARAAGAPIEVVSGFRSYSQQRATFDRWVQVGGYKQALRTSARPGHSEHQLGTTLDFTSAGGAAPWEHADWGTTPAGAWMAANAWRFGFVMSYPAGAFEETGYDYEPWHYRYVGRDLAAAVHASGLPLRLYQWERR